MDRNDSALDALSCLVSDGEVVVLSGAGLSTESGIPDYRGPSGVARLHTPMTYQTFTRDEQARRRYWARSYLGWRQVAAAVPNDGHRAVARLEELGLLAGIVTQNVDGLHQAAGARSVLELHGSLGAVVCLDCGRSSSRLDLDARLRDANPGWRPASGPVNPDGDVDLDDAELEGFVAVPCEVCGGTLKPDVVFFGEAVPPARVAASYALVERAGLLLVLGSSLTVMSGFRFVLRAAKLGVPVAIVNAGPTRGDAHARVRIDAPLGQVLRELVGAVPAPALAAPAGR
ncbi:NAD-dependent protein deacetylase [Motilibacter aurantiacus]|uniref:NAD-dependent protein deacetylase n=1 Tax=Motilibacter aurantiacus TaxID=2714955 RepID=UPI00140BE73A|nr:NAD-dependent protein deacetylase [Motilibacter aurantiacus]NHC46574.1 NAD-dependent protein deacetylase [Motilibacter aurantiacus]